MAFEEAQNFLKQQHLAPLLSTVNQSLVTLNKWSTSLGQNNILSAPVLDEDGEYFGCLSVNDLLKSLYKGEGVHHRLFVCCNAHEQKSNTVSNTTVINITPGSERLSASGLKVTHVVSQSDVVKLLWANKAVLGDTLAKTVEELELDAVS
eukprot:gene12845-12972_t